MAMPFKPVAAWRRQMSASYDLRTLPCLTDTHGAHTSLFLAAVCCPCLVYRAKRYGRPHRSWDAACSRHDAKRSEEPRQSGAHTYTERHPAGEWTLHLPNEQSAACLANSTHPDMNACTYAAVLVTWCSPTLQLAAEQAFLTRFSPPCPYR